jgi:protein TonB
VLVNVEPVLKRPLIEEKKGSVLDFLKALGAKKVKKVSRKKKRYSLRKIASFKMVKKNKNIIRGLIVEGNKIKKGKRFTVESTFSKDEQELRAFKKYSEKIKNSVKKFWKLPEYLKVKKNIRCRIQIFLSKDGVLLRSNVFETSGYNEYDKRALQTIKKAAPFPPMDTELIDRALRGDLIFGFPL